MMWSSLLGRPKMKPEPEPEPPKRTISRVGQEFGPPITAEEEGANLSELEQRLNREMKCHAGKNQVFIRSLLTGSNTTQPRIALKCHLRRDIGLKPEVFYEHIRDICCGDPDRCEAYRDLKERFVET
jgi:hypothetical protein